MYCVFCGSGRNVEFARITDKPGSKSWSLCCECRRVLKDQPALFVQWEKDELQTSDYLRTAVDD